MAKRLDQRLVEMGLAVSRERAQSLILAGKVLVDDNPKLKPGSFVPDSSVIRVRGEDHPYVSRGGLKLQAALSEFKIQVSGRTAMDIGASTGGFSHVLLLNQVHRVIALDVGYNQMHWKIRSDPRVQVLEKINARYLDFSQIGEKVDILVIDVSFISLEKILPALVQFAHAQTDWVTLIKPQFEVGRNKVSKGGVVLNESDQKESVDRITRFTESLGLRRLGLIESPIKGMNGNREFLAHWKIRSRNEQGMNA